MRHADALILTEMRELCRSGGAQKLRIRAFLSRQEVADICKVSRQAVALWETGKRTPTGVPALAYAKLLRQLARQVM
jgi:DNA-binding XRE family transcriptional regulator